MLRGFSRDNKKFFLLAIEVFLGAGGGARRLVGPAFGGGGCGGCFWLKVPLEAFPFRETPFSGEIVLLAFVISVVMVMVGDEDVDWLLFWPPDCLFWLIDSLEFLRKPFGDWWSFWTAFLEADLFDAVGEFGVCADDDPVPDPADACPMVMVAAGDFLVELFLATPLRPLKHRESSAAARFVKLTSADMPTTPFPLVALFQAALKTTKKQATFTTQVRAFFFTFDKRADARKWYYEHTTWINVLLFLWWKNFMSSSSLLVGD